MYKLKKLTQAQKNKLKQHSKKYSVKHLASMRMNITLKRRVKIQK